MAHVSHEVEAALALGWPELSRNGYLVEFPGYYDDAKGIGSYGAGHESLMELPILMGILELEGLVENARRVGDRLLERLRTLPALHDVRGRGLMIGFDVEGSASELRRRLVFEQHVFTGGAGAHTVRLLPALGLSEAQADEFVARLKALLEDFH